MGGRVFMGSEENQSNNYSVPNEYLFNFLNFRRLVVKVQELEKQIYLLKLAIEKYNKKP